MGTENHFWGGTEEALVEALYLEGDGLSLTRVNGPAYCEDEYRQAVLDGYDVHCWRDGVYIFELAYNAGQFDNLGRCELPPCWEADLIEFEEVTDAD